jgi:S1-C subfamily serine protease
MKKSLSTAFLTICLFSFLAAQSNGGTSIERKFERIEEKAEQFAENIETKAETVAERWERRAERFEAKAERFGERMENNWSANFKGRNIGFTSTACPEISFLGIEAYEVSIEKAKKLGFENRYGSYVSKVMAKSAAETAGLQAFDYIYGVDEQRTSNNQSLSDILEDYEVGNEVTLYFVRKGQKMNIKVKLGESDGYETEDDEQRPFLGVSPEDDGDNDELNGVSVDVVEKSAAEEMGLKMGDVITAINGFPVLDWDDVTTAIQNTKPGQAIEVAFEREGRELTAKGTVKAYDEVYPENEGGNWNLDIDWDETGKADIIIGDDWGNTWDGYEQDENRAFIGIYTDMISKEKATKLGFDNPYGTYVTGIIPNSGADKAGLKPFDYIYGFDEYRAGEQQNLGVVMKKYKPGDKATVHFVRKGKKATASLTFTKPMKEKKEDMDSCEDGFFGIIQKGSDEDDGVTISPVKGSTAAELGLQEGDLITHINGYRMSDWQDITTAINLVKPGETISVDYERNGKAMKGSKPLKSLAQTKNCANCDCGEKESVVIATTPGSGWSGWSNSSSKSDVPMPRMDMKNARVSTDNINADEANELRSKGVNLGTNSLSVDGLRISPNASTGQFSLEFNLPTSGNTIVKIYNLTGRELYEYDLGSFSGKFSDNVDLGQNGPGSYFLEVTQGGKVFTKKVTLAKG